MRTYNNLAKLVYSNDYTFLNYLFDILQPPIMDDSYTIIYAFTGDMRREDLVGAIIISLSITEDNSEIINIGKIEYIASKKKGVGTLLLLEAEQWFRTKLEKPIIHVVSLATAVGFYRTMGFEIIPDYDDQIFDSKSLIISMRKVL